MKTKKKKLMLLTGGMVFLTVWIGLLCLFPSALSSSVSDKSVGTSLPREMLDALPEELSALLSAPDAEADVDPYDDPMTADPEAAASSVNAGFFFSLLLDALNAAWKPILKECAGLFVMILLCAILEAGAGSVGPLEKNLRLLRILTYGLTLYHVTSRAWDTVTDAIRTATAWMTAMLPAVTAACAASGQITTASIAESGLLLYLSFWERLCSDGLLPLLKLCFAFSFVNALQDTNTGSLAGFTGMLKTFFLLLTGVLTAVFGVAMTFQTRLSKSADSVILRSMKLAAGQFLPVIGGAVSEASSTVIGSLQTMRVTVGIAAEIALIAAAAVPLIRLILYRIVFGMASGTAKWLGCAREGNLTSDLSGLLSIGGGLVCLCFVMLLYAIVLICGHT